MMCYIRSHLGFGLRPGAGPAGQQGQARPTAWRRARGVHSSTEPRGARAGRGRALAIGATENTGTAIRSRRHVRDARHSETLERERGSEAGVATDSQISVLVVRGCRRGGMSKKVGADVDEKYKVSELSRGEPWPAGRAAEGRGGGQEPRRGLTGLAAQCHDDDAGADVESQKATATSPNGMVPQGQRKTKKVFGAMLKSRSTC
jgi:hypothetical protein